jgi:hypothetical protein
MTDNSKLTGAAIEAHYQFLGWLVPTIDKFPKSHKFTIGDRIETISARRAGSADRGPPTPRSGRLAPIARRMLQCMSRFVALNDRPPFSDRPSLTGHCGHGWTCSLPRPSRD